MARAVAARAAQVWAVWDRLTPGLAAVPVVAALAAVAALVAVVALVVAVAEQAAEAALVAVAAAAEVPVQAVAARAAGAELREPLDEKTPQNCLRGLFHVESVVTVSRRSAVRGSGPG
jgi:hypothetical protein